MSRSHDFLALLATITHGRALGAFAQGTVCRAAIVAAAQGGRYALGVVGSRRDTGRKMRHGRLGRLALEVVVFKEIFE